MNNTNTNTEKAILNFGKIAYNWKEKKNAVEVEIKLRPSTKTNAIEMQ